MRIFAAVGLMVTVTLLFQPWALAESKMISLTESTDSGEREEEARKVFDDLAEKMTKAREAHYKPLQVAREKGLSGKELDKIELDPELEPIKVVGPEMMKAIQKYAGTAAALEACDQMLGMAGRSKDQSWMVEKVVGVLRTDYIEDPELLQVVRYAYYGSDCSAMLDFLRTVVSDSPHRKVQAASCYSLAKMLGKKEETRKDGLAMLRKVETQFGDVSVRGDRVYGDLVKGDLFEMENLQVGCVAPEIIGKEISGKLMQLSAFRGKVVLLDFWGDW